MSSEKKEGVLRVLIIQNKKARSKLRRYLIVGLQFNKKNVQEEVKLSQHSL